MTHDVTRAAGRELDALVAEKVMGWTVNRTGDRHWHTVGETGRERSIQIGSDCCAGQHYDAFAFIPSQHIRAAWEVVEHMIAHGWPLYQVGALVSFGESPNAAYAQFAEGWLPEWHRAEAPTVAHAICLAAVRAVGALPTSNTEPKK